MDIFSLCGCCSAWSTGVHCSNLSYCLIPDVISIDKTGENFRLIYDTKGRFAIHRITPEEAKVSDASTLGCCFKVLDSKLQPELSTWADPLW